MREVADLYMYGNNTVVAVLVTGAQVLEWLESSARGFNRVDPSASGPQALVDKRVPTYNFDVVAGVTYRIDVTQPPRYDGHGKLDASARRIVDLSFEGRPIDPRREFVVVSNNYRADGGGNFPALAGAKIALRAPDANRDAVLRYFRAQASVPVAKSFPWSFAPIGRPAARLFRHRQSRRLARRRRRRIERTGRGRTGLCARRPDARLSRRRRLSAPVSPARDGSRASH